MRVLPIVVGMLGVVLLWASWKNKAPLDAIKLGLQGQDPNGAGPFVVTGLGPSTATGPTAVPAPAGAAPILPGGPVGGGG
jgi:hypothetical protein